MEHQEPAKKKRRRPRRRPRVQKPRPLSGNIVLCGFMGCGKSTVGKILAKKMGCQCVDLDKYIENTAGMSIPEIFDKYGEEHFRKLETEALAAFADIGGVVATGGGALLSEENGKVAKRSGMVVFIDTYFNTCYGRIKNDPNRPIAYNSTREQLLERFEQFERMLKGGG